MFGLDNTLSMWQSKIVLFCDENLAALLSLLT